jgi:hypothetical protein
LVLLQQLTSTYNRRQSQGVLKELKPSADAGLGQPA